MSIQSIQGSIKTYRSDLLEHSVYSQITSVEEVRVFMEIHAFAVWDFMSLLKALQNKLTCISLPWKPVASPSTARFINEIVLGEETDVNPKGEVKSHYELYLEAMNDLNASTNSITLLLDHCNSIPELLNYLDATSDLPNGIKKFLRFSFELIENGKTHEIAAAFTFGREDLIPDLFTSIIKGLNQENDELEALIYYLERHIELDGDEHGPLSLRMIEELCEDDAEKWQEAEIAAIKALEVRQHLWNEISQKIEQSKMTV